MSLHDDGKKRMKPSKKNKALLWSQDRGDAPAYDKVAMKREGVPKNYKDKNKRRLVREKACERKKMDARFQKDERKKERESYRTNIKERKRQKENAEKEKRKDERRAIRKERKEEKAAKKERKRERNEVRRARKERKLKKSKLEDKKEKSRDPVTIRKKMSEERKTKVPQSNDLKKSSGRLALSELKKKGVKVLPKNLSLKK